MLHEEYVELLSLTQLYLLQEFHPQERITVAPDFFKAHPSQPVPTPKPVNIPASNLPVQKLPTPQVTVKPDKLQPVQTVTAPAIEVTPQAKAVSKAPASSTPLPEPSADFFKLIPMTPASASDLQDIREIISKKFPHFSILETPPADLQSGNDMKAQIAAASVIILSFQESMTAHTFLENVSQAISHCFVPSAIIPAHIVEQEQNWDLLAQAKGVRLIIASGAKIENFSGFMKRCRQSDRQKSAFFGEIPLLLLPDLAIYLKEPNYKSDLWRAIQQMLLK